MLFENEPVPKTWYRDIQSERVFYVIGVDADKDLVEIQHFDGDIEQVDLGEWLELDLELAEPPEDWSGPVDRVETEDLDHGESAARKLDEDLQPSARPLFDRS